MNPLPNQEYQYLLHYLDTPMYKSVHEIVSHSRFFIQESLNLSNVTNLFDVTVIIDPEVMKKHQGHLTQHRNTISSKLKETTGRQILRIEIRPDLEKFKILNNNITPVLTPWENINQFQNHIINLLRTAKETIDYQNIGNASRTILQKVSSAVFDKKIHTASQELDLSEGKFKNRLHIYIRCQLVGSENSELRNYAIAIITAAEKSVDLSNKLTHDLNASNFMAESCVICTLTVINIIKMIHDRSVL